MPAIMSAIKPAAVPAAAAAVAAAAGPRRQRPSERPRPARSPRRPLTRPATERHRRSSTLCGAVAGARFRQPTRRVETQVTSDTYVTSVRAVSPSRAVDTVHRYRGDRGHPAVGDPRRARRRPRPGGARAPQVVAAAADRPRRRRDDPRDPSGHAVLPGRADRSQTSPAPSARVRAKKPDGCWGPWYEAETPRRRRAPTARAAAVPAGTDPVFVGRTTTVQIAVTRPTDAPVIGTEHARTGPQRQRGTTVWVTGPPPWSSRSGRTSTPY